ncbi:MAG: TrmB family transcriptional regulator [Nanoarchaeota archaeon]|nr:TrmB family transcriptional regulator [Nanoarchaeota archaeon]
MEREETTKNTKLFGLNTYEARIWTALLSRGVSTAGELSDIANVPRSRSYDVLESLEKKGFVVMKLGKPIKYLAIPPKEVLENIKKLIEKTKEKRLLEIKSNSFSNLINTFQELYDRSADQTENIVAILRGRKNIHKHISFLFKYIKKDILFSVENENHEHLTIDKIKDKTKIMARFPKIGARICVVDDDNSLIFPIQEQDVHPDYDLCLWIRDKQTTKFLRQLLSSA